MSFAKNKTKKNIFERMFAMPKISHNLLKKNCSLLMLACMLSTPVWAAPPDSPDYLPDKLSSNISLGSYVYGYLEKLSGLGYLPEVLPGTKPYTRLQAARWLRKIDRSNLDTAPAYVRSMLHNLDKEFAAELDTLQNTAPPASFALREISAGATYYDGDTLPNRHTASTYQPLNINNNGYRYNPGTNGTLRLQLAGKLGSRALASLTPRLDLRNGEDADADLEAAYIKTAWGNWELQAGKDPLWWGPGLRGTRALTNNAPPVAGVKISTIEPLRARGLFKPLGKVGVTSFYGKMDEDRTDIQNPGFFGLRTDIQPGKNITIGTSLTAIVGGDGRGLSWSDFWHFLTGENATDPAKDKWNSIAGLDFRWRLPNTHGIQLYGELYGEDQAKALGFLPTPSKNSELVGIYIPRLSPSGDWDAAFEYAHTGTWAYSHWVYTDGYVNAGNIIGDAMGWNATRYYARFTHYSDSANSLSLHLEHLTQDTSYPTPQKLDSVWITTQHFLKRDSYLTAAAGVSFIKNAHYTAGNDERNYLLNLSYTKKY